MKDLSETVAMVAMPGHRSVTCRAPPGGFNDIPA